MSDHCGRHTLSANAGPFPIAARRDGDRTLGTVRSPDPDSLPLASPRPAVPVAARAELVGNDLYPDFPRAVRFAGKNHPVLVVAGLDRLASLAYDFDALQGLCRTHDWVTLQLVAATGPGQWRARDPFPWGGVVEDPATYAAAAALAGYLRAPGRATTGDTLVITQGVEMERPSRIGVELIRDAAQVTGAATGISQLD